MSFSLGENKLIEVYRSSDQMHEEELILCLWPKA